MSASIYGRLRSVFVKNPNLTSSVRYKPKSKTSISKSSQSSEIESLVKKFKKSSNISTFRRRSSVYEATVRRLTNAEQFSAIKDILEHQKKYPDIKKEHFVIRLIGLYGKAKMFEEAQKLFDEMPSLNCERTVVSFNALLAACVNAKDYDKINLLFKELPGKLSIKPNVVSYNTMIKALCEMGSLDSAVLMMDEMESNSIMPNLVTFNTLLDAFYRNERISEAEELWVLMEKKNLVPNVRSYNSRLRGFVRANRVPDAVGLMEEMKTKGIEPDSHSYTAFIRGFVCSGELEEAKKWHHLMTENGCTADWATFVMLVPFACDKEDFDYAYKLCEEYIRINRKAYNPIITRVVNGLTERNKNEQARKLVEMAEA